ncbi:MAG TPA: hypothetical protein VFW02_09755 [Candidatus Limnocylindrales bacterium]|nr:hypothetical protein [Candidatus Limnocylindrales bacterium]
MQPIARPRALGPVVSLAILLASLLAACAGPGRSASSQSPASEATAGTHPTAAPPAAVADASSDAFLVVGRQGQAGLEVIVASSLERVYELPAGVPGEHWGTLVAATQADGATVVEDITVQPELPARDRSVPGNWRLPSIGDDALPVGVSADGSTVVLVEDGKAGEAATTRFAVLARGSAARILELPGSLEFDALSPDGSILYVVEHLPGPPDAHYQVRAVDLPSGLVRDAVIVDKRNLDESMGGWPITQARHGNGVAFTLYRGAEHPFVHALNTVEAWAVCLDLPEIGSDDPKAAGDWGLATHGDRGAVYTVNATLGLAAAIDPGELSIRRTASFEAPRAAATISLAKFGHQDAGPVGRRAVVSPDGSSLYAAGAGGIVRLETERLTVTRTLLTGAAVDALALTPDGSTLYALLGADGRIVKLDAASGEVLGQVPGAGFDRLVAVVPG